MDLETLNPERVEAIFVRHGAYAVSYSDAGGEPVLEPAPGASPLWADSRISGLFPADADLGSLRAALSREFGRDRLPACNVETVEDRDWAREWLRDFAPMRFGRRLWVVPGDADIDEPGAAVVRLDPGLAFGTGTHATTALCLEWLDGLELDGATLLDVGCGSGILAIAALRLGATSAVGTDIDPQALAASRSNAQRNRVADRLSTPADAQAVGGGFDVVVANILAAPLVEMAATIAARVRPGGRLALSGILAAQVDDIRAAYAPWIAFEAAVTRNQGGQCWARLSGIRKPNQGPG